MKQRTVIDFLRAVHQGAPGYAQLIRRLPHKRRSGNHSHRHGQRQENGIPRQPFAGNQPVAILTVDFFIFGLYSLLPGPFRNAEGQRAIRAAALHPQGHTTVPQQISLYFEAQRAAVQRRSQLRAHIQMDVQGIRRLGKGIRGQGRNNAGDIGRAAGAAKPFLTHGLHMGQAAIGAAGGRVHLQRVDIEEGLAVQRHACQHGIVQSALHHIGVATIRIHLQHTPGKEGQADGGAGFGIGGIAGQIVGTAEGFAVMGAAHAAGDVHFLLHRGPPQLLAGRHHGFIPRFPGGVRHAAAQVHLPHGVAHGFLHLAYRPVGLIIRIPLRRDRQGVQPPLLPSGILLQSEGAWLRAAHIQEEAGQLPPFGIARFLVQAKQRHFGDLMAGAATLSLRPKAPGDMIAEAFRHLQQIASAGGLMPGHSGLRQVAEAVQLVVVLQVGKSAAAIHQRIEGIQVSVLLLGGADGVDGLLGLGLQGGVRTAGQLIGHSLQPFITVAVLKHPAVKIILGGRLARSRLRQHAFADGMHGQIAARLAGGHGPGSGAHIVHPPAGRGPRNTVVQGIPLIGNHGGAHQLHLPQPEGIRHMHVLQLYRGGNIHTITSAKRAPKAGHPGQTGARSHNPSRHSGRKWDAGFQGGKGAAHCQTGLPAPGGIRRPALRFQADPLPFPGRRRER